MSGYRFNRVRNATLKSFAYYPPPTPFVPHCPLTSCPQQAWESDRSRRRVTEKNAQEIVALSYPTKADDLSRFFRDPSAKASGLFAPMLRTTRTKELQMKTYTILYAQDIPHYGSVELEAENDAEIVAAARGYWDATELDPADDPDWNNPVCKRIVEISDEA